MSRVNEGAAGVDIGATEIVACVLGGDGTQLVKAFGNYTVDLQAIGKWFYEHGTKTVAMESTGVYWIPLFEELERQGFECLLISSRSIKRVPGRKRAAKLGYQLIPAQGHAGRKEASSGENACFTFNGGG